jgi:hypothetical protein
MFALERIIISSATVSFLSKLGIRADSVDKYCKKVSFPYTVNRFSLEVLEASN